MEEVSLRDKGIIVVEVGVVRDFYFLDSLVLVILVGIGERDGMFFLGFLLFLGILMVVICFCVIIGNVVFIV